MASSLGPSAHHVNRHPVGIIASFVFAIAFIAAVSLIYFLVIPELAAGSPLLHELSTTVYAITIIGTVFFMYIVDRVYWGNHIIIQGDYLERHIQSGLFRHSIDRINLIEVEQVVAQQYSFLERLLHYGDLFIEFNSQRPQISLSHCPEPDYYASLILSKKQLYIEAVHSDEDMSPALNKNELPFGISYLKAIIARNHSMTIEQFLG